MSEDRPSVYLAGPIQHSDDGGHGWRNDVIRTYPERFDWVNPLDEFDGGEDTATILPEAEAEEYDATPDEEVITDTEVVETDKALVQDVDALLIGFPKKVPAWGTPMEQNEVWESDAFGGATPTKPVTVWHGFTPWQDLSPWLRYHSTHHSAAMGECVTYLDGELL